jgi:hypothetical protein
VRCEQASLTALLSCTVRTSTTSAIHRLHGGSEATNHERISSLTYKLPLSGMPHNDPSLRAKNLPASDSCSAPLCNTDGLWTFQLRPQYTSAQSFLLDFSASTSGTHRTSQGNFSWYQPVRACTSSASKQEGCSTAEYQTSVSLVLPPSSSCAALVLNEHEAFPELHTVLLTASPCPSREELQRDWPWVLQDAAAAAMYAPDKHA